MVEKIGYLDGLRGLASLSVFLFHFVLLFYPSIESGILFYGLPFINLIWAGHFAVCIFFVLSGYVLTRSFFLDKEHERLVSGVVRRYIRLLIPVLATSLVVYLFISINFFPTTEGIAGTWSLFNGTPKGILDMLSQTFWGTFFEGQNTYNNVLWTMTYEFMGSMIVFSFASLFGRLKNRWIFYLAAIIFFLKTLYLGFLLGMLLADLYNSNPTNTSLKLNNTIIKLILLVTGLFLGSYMVNGSGMTAIVYTLMGDFYNFIMSIMPIPIASNMLTGLNWITPPQIFYYTVGAFIILLVLLNSSILKQILSSRIPVFIGGISFSLYLLHPIILCSYSVSLFSLLYPHISYLAASVIVLLSTTVILAGCSYAMKLYVDDPGVQLSKAIYARFFTGEPRAIDWNVLEKKILVFVRKNLPALILAELVLIAAVIGVLVFVKPVVDQGNARQAYYDQLDGMDVFGYLGDIPPDNNSSPSVYRAWLDVFEADQDKALMASNALDNSGRQYLLYLNNTTGEYSGIENNLSFYRGLASISLNMSYTYENQYQAIQNHHGDG